MSFQKSSYVLLVAVCALLLGFATGCGGGGDESGSQQENGSGSQQQEGGSRAGGETSGAQADGTGGEDGSAENKTALGVIGSVKLDNDRFTLRPSGDGERMVFKLRENTRIELDGREVKPADIRQGQQAQIQYVVRNERNVARVVTLFSAEGNSEGGGTGS